MDYGHFLGYNNENAFKKGDFIIFDIERIEKMEEKFNRAAEAINALDSALAGYAEALGDIKTLADYIASDEWKEDFAADERGALPADLKRGVLSEDGLYNLLEKNGILLDIMKEILGNMN